jgi:hypothetical protein
MWQNVVAPLVVVIIAVLCSEGNYSALIATTMLQTKRDLKWCIARTIAAIACVGYTWPGSAVQDGLLILVVADVVSLAAAPTSPDKRAYI